jgi:hypothetical protein
MVRARAGHGLGLVLGTMVAASVLVACEPTLEQQSGIVIGIDSPALGRVDSFELLTPSGETYDFDTRELAFRPEFPASHLAEHRVLGDTIVVTYKQDGPRRIVTQLDDAAH